MKKTLYIILGVGIWGLLLGNFLPAADGQRIRLSIPSLQPDEQKTLLPKEKIQMKFLFYRINKETGGKGESVGSAELSGDRLNYTVTDLRLEKILKGDYHTIIAGEENGKKVEKSVTYKVGTPQHFEKVIENCNAMGIIAEREPSF